MNILGWFTRKPRKAPQQLRPGRGWTTEVHGESHYQPAISRSYKRHGGLGSDLKVSATLVPEPTNQHDPNAVRVEIDGRTVGYLPRAKASEYRSMLGLQEGQCSAKITGGHERDNGERAFFGVKLNMRWPPALLV
jgi:hypothetical protein